MTLLTSAECREIAERKMVEAEGDPWRTSPSLRPSLSFRYSQGCFVALEDTTLNHPSLRNPKVAYRFVITSLRPSETRSSRNSRFRHCANTRFELLPI